MPAVENAQPQEIRDLHWNDFQLQMLMNAGYQKLSNATRSQIARSRFEAYIVQKVENWPIAAQLWQLMLGGLSELEQPLSEDIEQWNEIARLTNMPIHFNENGLLVPEGGA